MELLTKTLFLCLALAFTNGDPVAPSDTAVDDAALPNRCKDVEFDAIAPDEKGNTFFFKDGYLWKGFHGGAKPANETFKELDDIHDIGHVDAAFRMHNADNPDDHDHTYFFLDNKVFSYYNYTLEEGYPKDIQEDFPGVPSHLDAAVECPKGECMGDSVLFFKGHDVHVYDIATKTVKIKTWDHLPVCTSALRWLEHYYCFNGHNFTRFNPVSGEVGGNYPKDARSYFMKCHDTRSHGGDYEFPKCSDIKLSGMTTDDEGKSYLFSGPMYMRLDTRDDGLHVFPITKMWKEMVNGVDAAFPYDKNMYLIKDDHIYIYKKAAQYGLIDGYPKTLVEELGIDGHVNAAFTCPEHHSVYIIQGKMMKEVNLTATPRVPNEGVPLPFTDIDAAQCNTKGIYLFQGSQYYHYLSPMILAMGRMTPVPHPVTNAMLGCRD